MILEIKHLKLIQAVAEEGGLTSAGLRLHLTQSALSHQLREVEERLGVALFDRKGRRMTPTRAGERAYQEALQMLERLSLLEQELKGLAAHACDVIRVTVECYTCYHWLPTCMRMFRLRHPGGEVRVAAEAAPRPVAAVLDGHVDVALVSTAETRSRQLHTEPLFRDEVLAVMTPDHPLARNRWIEPEDLRDETLVLYTSLGESTTYRDLLAPAGVTPRHTLRIQVTEGMLEFARAGLGIALVARWAAASYLAAGRLVGLRIRKEGFHRDWTAVVLRSRANDPAIKDFLTAIRATYEETGFERLDPSALPQAPASDRDCPVDTGADDGGHGRLPPGVLPN